MSIMQAIGIILILVIVWSLYAAHRNPGVSVNAFDLLIENGRLSKLSCVFMGAWSLHSWIMVELTVQGKMTEGYLTIYGATWVAPVIARLFAPPPPPQTTTTTTTTEIKESS